jgi:hypothetical protein
MAIISVMAWHNVAYEIIMASIISIINGVIMSIMA